MKTVTVGKEFHFEAAHYLQGYPGDCARLHGHTFRVQVEVWGEVDPATGMVLDFRVLARVVEAWLDSLDHQDLNQVLDQESPTVEFLASWLLEKLTIPFSSRKNLQGVRAVIQEGEGGWASVEREFPRSSPNI